MSKTRKFRDPRAEPTGMSLDEIAEATGMTYQQVRYTLSKALMKLRLGAICRGEKAEDYYDIN